MKTFKHLETCLFLSFIVALLPFLVLTLYTHPGADDYCFAILRKEYGFWGAQVVQYTQMLGRYFFCFVVAFLHLVPASIHADILFYRIMSFFVILLLIITPYIFLSAFVPQIDSKKKRLLCSLGFSYLFISRMQSTADLYWDGGFLLYFFPTMLTALVAVLVKTASDTHTMLQKMGTYITGGLLAVMIVGSNETNMVLLGIILLCSFFLFGPLTRSQKAAIWVILSVTIVCSIVAIAAPGNFRREAILRQSPLYHGTLLGNSIRGLVACGYTQFMSINTLVNLPFIGIFIGYGWLIYHSKPLKSPPRAVSSFSNLLLILFGILIYCMSVLPTDVIYGGPGTTRSHEAAYLNLLFLCILGIPRVTAFLKTSVFAEFSLPSFSLGWSRLAIVRIAAYLVVFGAIVFEPNVVEAVKDIGMGKAAYYNKSWSTAFNDANFQANHGVKRVELKGIPITMMPRSVNLYFSEDSTAYDNTAFARILGVETVRVVPFDWRTFAKQE